MSLSKIPPKAFLSRQFDRKSRTQVLSGLKLFFLRNPPTSASPHASRRQSLLPCPKYAALSSFPFEGKKMRKKQILFCTNQQRGSRRRSEKGSGSSLFHFPPTLEKTQRSAAYFFFSADAVRRRLPFGEFPPTNVFCFLTREFRRCPRSGGGLKNSAYALFPLPTPQFQSATSTTYICTTRKMRGTTGAFTQNCGRHEKEFKEKQSLFIFRCCAIMDVFLRPIPLLYHDPAPPTYVGRSQKKKAEDKGTYMEELPRLISACSNCHGDCEK